ncbi:MAG TPA: fatty acid desaturase [Burkholderiaceae bacterium]|jgi:fatty acid desaturase|nr:fatty acid desaturase [Burkholderiaceae bacterium]
MGSEVAYGSELVVPRQRLKQLVRRNNWIGSLYLCGHLALLGLTGIGIHAAIGTGWLPFAMAAHGVAMAFLFAPMHELSHGTAFRSRWFNELAFRAISFIYISPPVFFRYFHAAHHTYTQIRGKDPDIVLPGPASWGDYLYYVSSIPLWRRNAAWFVSHALGRISDRDSWYVPRDEWPRVYREARVMLMLYGGIAVGAVALGSWAPLLYWIVPRLIGEPVMRWMRVAEHVGCDYTADLRRNTRTTRPSLLLRGLFWNMSYHAEHHLCPAVPFHALPQLHREASQHLHPVGSGYLAVHREILSRTLEHRFRRLIRPAAPQARAQGNG